jgi:cytochrome c-type biogenesis protein CcmE
MTARVLPSGWRGRVPLLILVLAVVVAVTLLATAGAEGSLSYYRTPSEVLAAPSSGQVRLGGLVVPGSIHRHGDALWFALTDDKQQVEVVSDVVPPRTFRPGQGAVVQGVLNGHGVFEARSVVVRHDNQYKPSEMLSH